MAAICPRRPEVPSPAPPVCSFCMPHPVQKNFAKKGKCKTLHASDVLLAMEEMEFQQFITPLKEALETHRREQKSKKEALEQKKDKDKKADSKEQDKSREEEDENEERLDEEEHAKGEEVDKGMERVGTLWHGGTDHPEILRCVCVKPLPARWSCLLHWCLRSK